MDNNALVVVIFLVVIASFFIVARKKDMDPSQSAPVSKRTSPQKQREEFSSMTVSELKTYIKENKQEGAKGRVPTRKADLIEASMNLWLSTYRSK